MPVPLFAPYSPLFHTNFSTDHFIQMIYDEPAQKRIPGIILSPLSDKEAEKRILAFVGATQETITYKYVMDQAGTSSLIKGLSIDVLLERMIETDIVSNVDLAGLVEFLKRGVKYSDIDPIDIRPFKAVMGDTQSMFHSDIGNVLQVRATNLALFIKSFSKSSDDNHFTTMALQ